MLQFPLLFLSNKEVEEVMTSSLPIDIQSSLLQPKITILGVGSGGSGVVCNIAECSLDHVSLVTCDTQRKKSFPPEINFIDLSEATDGYGTGGNSEMGAEIASDYQEQIAEVLEETKMLLLISTLGGGFGTGASPVIAKLAKDLGVLTVCIVTLPFDMEGKTKAALADQGILHLRQHADVIIELPNESLFNSDDNDSAEDFFKQTDDFIKSSVQGITNIINTTGTINVDFADIHAIMHNMGSAVIGEGYASGEDALQQAVDHAMASPLLQNMEIKEAKGLLLNIVGDVGILDLDDVMKKLEGKLHEDVNTILGKASSQDSNHDMVHVTLILTGVPERQIESS